MTTMIVNKLIHQLNMGLKPSCEQKKREAKGLVHAMRRVMALTSKL